MAGSKYKNKKIVIDGITFDSKDESYYYQYLLKLKAEGKIINFELQPKYELQPAFQKNGKKYRPIYYVADFLVYHNDGSEEVIDIKGMAVPVALLKRKEFDYHYPELKLTWLVRNLKYGIDGWIEYDALKSIRSKNKKVKA